jgi:hypothetical protein
MGSIVAQDRVKIGILAVVVIGALCTTFVNPNLFKNLLADQSVPIGELMQGPKEGGK